MTISVSNRKAGPFLGNGVTSSFPFTFKVLDTTASPFGISAFRTTFAGVQSELSYGTGFTIVLNPDQDTSPGGTVEYRVASVVTPLPSGEKLTIKGNTVEDQQTDLVNGGAWNPTVIENSLDKLTAIVQEMLESLSRTIGYPVSDSVTASELPTAAVRANSFFAFDSSGNPTVSSLSGLGIATVTYVDAGDAAQSSALASHAANLSLHMTAGQNTFLDALAVSATEVNFLSGVTSSVQTQINGRQPLDAALSALASLAGAGVVVQTAADTFATRTLTAGSGISVTNGDGVSGNPTIAANPSSISHTALADIGGNTHAQIDAHLSSTSNPHGVTKAQVGLGSVTNDAQIVLSTVTTKGDLIAATGAAAVTRLPVGADGQILIADSAQASGVRWAAGYTDEQAQDAVGLNLLDTASVNLTYNDATGQISADVVSSGVDHNGLANLASGDVHTQYIKVDGTRAFTGTQATRQLQPDTDLTRDIGTAALRYKTLRNAQILCVSGTGGATTQHATANIIGRTQNDLGGGAAEIHADGVGSLVEATVLKTRAGAHHVHASATGLGSVIIGLASDAYGAAAASLVASGISSTVVGAAFSNGASAGTMTASGVASFVSGTAYGGSLTASGTGSVVLGYAVNTSITSSGSGSLALGYARGGSLIAGGNGAFAGGVALSGNITAGTLAAHQGAFAFGSTPSGGGAITASARGAFAFGLATTAIEASATNCVQFGPGTNSQPDSLSVGTTMRLKGTLGEPTTPRNGDLWVDATTGAIMKRSAGITSAV